MSKIQGGDGGEGVGNKLFSFWKCLVMTLVFCELIDLKLNKEKPEGKQKQKTLNVLRKDNEH